VPYKEAVIPYLDRLHPTAKAIGAVNTVKKEGKKWVGYNTDFEGFLTGLKHARFSPKGKSAVLLGAGGAAHAVCFGLGSKKISSVTLFDIDAKKVKHLAGLFRKTFPAVDWLTPDFTKENLRSSLGQANILVHATPVGLHSGDPLLVEKGIFPKRKILVYDLIYRPRRTRLLNAARQLGNKIINGETMLLYQGAKAFEIWTGKKAPVKLMKTALDQALSNG
jgi:shikimate dehydrogenase